MNDLSTEAENRNSNPADIPPDDPNRKLIIARPDSDSSSLPHIGLVGVTYTTLLSGNDTAGHLCLIDMHIPTGGGPPPHRHDFEETFIVLEGEIEAVFRGEESVIKAGETVHIPANAPHQFKNNGTQPVRLLCICAPSGQEEFFAKVGKSVASKTTVPPALSGEEQAEFIDKVKQLAPQYRTELLPPKL